MSLTRPLARMIVWALFFLLAWLGGLLWFNAQIPQTPAEALAQADAVVVLTGGAERLERGLHLLDRRRGGELFISGAGKDVTMDDIARLAPTLDHGMSILKFRIFLGHQAENTIGNAEETARWMRERGHDSLFLVTASYHMPRALSEFRALMPGVEIVPEPVFPANFRAEWWADTVSRQLVLSEYHKYLAGALRHWFIAATRAS